MLIWQYLTVMLLTILFHCLTGFPRSGPVRVITLGHSVNFWAYEQTCSTGSQLDLGGLANVYWLIRRGVQWGQLLLLLSEFMRNHPPPQVILLRGNNLIQMALVSLRVQANRDYFCVRLMVQRSLSSGPPSCLFRYGGEC